MEKLTEVLKQALIVLIACVPLTLGDCMKDLMECTETMPDINVILLGVEEMNRQELSKHCTTYEDIETCIRKKLYNCEPEVWDSIGKFRATFSSICYEDFEEYLIHSTCLSHVPAEDVCRDQYKTAIVKSTKTSKRTGWVEVFTINATKGAEGLCNATKDYLNCIENAANATCGSAAALFQHNLLRKGLVHELSDVDCDLGYDPTEGEDDKRVLVKSGLSLAAVAAIGLAIAVGVATLAVGSRYLCLKYAGELDPDEDELLADDNRSEISTDSSNKPGPSRPSTSRTGTSGSASSSASVV